MVDSMVEGSGTITLGGELAVHRLGFGAMRVTGEGVWGPPKDHDAALGLLRRVVDAGVDFIDTADSYGPNVSEELIAEALHPYPDDLVIGTKGGQVRPGPGDWRPDGRPEHLREACEGSLKRLRRDTIDLYQLHRVDPAVPFEEQVGVLTELRDEGKIRFIGLSNVDVDQLSSAQVETPIASVQNRYNLTDRASQPVLERCAEQGIAFLPWYPLATGDLAQSGGPLDEVAREHDATPSQVALAWLLQSSPVMLPIPGTSSIDHLEENLGAAALELSDDDLRRITEAADART